MKASPELQRVLGTGRFPGMSGKMAGIVHCILGRDDGFAELCVTSDGYLMGRLPNDCGYNEFLGIASELEDNWNNLLDATADASELPLTINLRAEAEALYTANIARH